MFSLNNYAQKKSNWRGENQDGIYNEKNLLKKWPVEGPKLTWSNDSLPTGYSSPAIGEDLIYLTGLVDTIDYIIALAHNGIEKWRKPFGRAWTESFSDSRSTPTIDGDKVYVQSGYCYVACFNAITGDEIWNVNAFEKFEGKTGIWGYSESLLIIDDKVLVTVGGLKTTMVALNKNTGETIWQSESLKDTTGYSSPILIEKNGKKVAVNVMANYVFGVDTDNGKILFKENYAKIDDKRSLIVWKDAPKINTNTPLYYKDELYVTSGYNHSGVKFKVANDLSKLEVAWTDSVLDVHHGGVVKVGDHIYGSNWINNGQGNWCCIDWKTGKAKYETQWQNKGVIIANDGILYCYDEKKGNIALVNANPEKFEVISSFKITHGKGPHWSHPVISKGILYIRHGKALMAYNIKEPSKS